MAHRLSNAPRIEHVPIASLKPYAGSARTHTADQRRKARSILIRFGQVVPVVIDEHHVIIDGHMIVEELAELGYDEVAAIVVRNRDVYDVRALRLALGRLSLDTKVDRSRLQAEFEALLEIGYDLSFTAFDALEIDAVFAIDEPGAGALEAPPPEPADGAIAISHSGDLIVLGRHRVLCGDARDPDAVARLMAGETARMAFLDVPYNVPISGFVSSGAHRPFLMASGEMTDAEFTAFLEDALRVACMALCDGAIVYACIDWRGLMALRPGSSFTCMLVWATDGTDHYLLEVVRDRMLIDSMERRLLDLIVHHCPKTVLIEEYSSGAALIRSTQKALLGTHLVTAVKIVKPSASKADRLARHVDVFANGHVFVPSDRPFGAAFIDEHLMFEAGGYSDQVDATSQYFDHVQGVLVSTFQRIVVGAGGSPVAKHPTPGPIKASHPSRPAHPQRDPRALQRSPYPRLR